MPPDRAIWEWTDVAAGFLRASNWFLPAGSSGALEVALQNASNAELLYATIAAPTVGAFTPVGGQYSLCQDVALFNFATVPGVSIQLVVPGPRNSLFGANSTVVDSTNALAAAIIAAAIGNLTDPAGNVATAFISGSKSSRRTEQI